MVDFEELHETSARFGLIAAKMAEESRAKGWRDTPPYDYRLANLELCGDAVREYADALSSGERRDALIVGRAGVGKTFSSLALLKHVEGALAVAFTSESSMLAELYTAKTSYTAPEPYGTAMVHYTLPGVLVVDDVGHSEYEKGRAEILRDVVDARRGKKRATIFTSNYDMGELAEKIAAADHKAAEPIISRLRACEIIKLDGPDRRISSQ